METVSVEDIVRQVTGGESTIATVNIASGDSAKTKSASGN